jgi:hypothetical protein
MTDLTLPVRHTLGWIYFPKRRFRVLLKRSIRAARRTFSRDDVTRVCRYTRQWIHYGLFAHIAVCTLVGAVEGVFGR